MRINFIEKILLERAKKKQVYPNYLFYFVHFDFRATYVQHMIYKTLTSKDDKYNISHMGMNNLILYLTIETY